MSGFPGELTAGNLTNMRGDYSGRPFMLATPESIIFQAELPSLSGIYASITYGTIEAGAYADVLPDMVYVITSTKTDFNKPVMRGYIRSGGATATTIYIDMQDDTLTSGYYITVFDDYDIFPRKPFRSLNTNYIDYNKTFELLPPYIGGLQSVYAIDTTAASDTIPFTPTCVAMSEGAAISSYLWNVGDGTITVGTSTDKNVTISFPAGHRWVHFTTTDDNGISHTIHFEVFIGDLITADFTLHGTDSIQWSGNFDGWSGSCPMYADLENVVDNQRITICLSETNNGVAGSINTNIALIGRYRIEATKTDGGNAENRNIQDSTLTIEGFGTTLSSIPIPKFNVTDVDTPAVWNDIIDPSPIRVIWHTLTRYTTAGNLVSFDVLSDDLVYKSGAIAASPQGCLAAINQVASRYTAQCNFSADGTLRIRKDTNFITDRSGLNVVADIEPKDIVSYEVTTTYNDTVGQVIGGGLWYQPSQKTYQFFIAKAPTITSTIGEETEQFNNQILDSTDTATDASEDLQNRTAAKLAQTRTQVQATVDLFDSWRFITPSNYDRYTIYIPTYLNLRDKEYTTSMYWQLQSISCTANVKDGTVSTRGVFVLETEAGTAGRVVAKVPLVSDVEIPLNPVMQPYAGEFDVSGYLFNPLDTGDGLWEVSPEALQATEPIDGNAINPMPQAGRGIYYTYFSDSTGVSTSFNTVLGETYVIECFGDAVIEENDLTYLNLYGNGQGDLLPYSGSLADPGDTPQSGAGVYTASGGGYTDFFDSVETAGMVANVVYPIKDIFGKALYVTSMRVEWRGDRQGGYFDIPSGSDKNCGLFLDDQYSGGGSFGSTNYTNQELSRTAVAGVDYAAKKAENIYIHGHMDMPSTLGAVRLTRFDVTLEGSDVRRGDAFYKNYNVGEAEYYGLGNGLLLDGSSFVTVPEYSSSHSYRFTVTGTGSPFTFSYGDTTSYADNEARPLIIYVTGSGAK